MLPIMISSNWSHLSRLSNPQIGWIVLNKTISVRLSVNEFPLKKFVSLVKCLQQDLAPLIIKFWYRYVSQAPQYCQIMLYWEHYVKNEQILWYYFLGWNWGFKMKYRGCSWILLHTEVDFVSDPAEDETLKLLLCQWIIQNSRPGRINENDIKYIRTQLIWNGTNKNHVISHKLVA